MMYNIKTVIALFAFSFAISCEDETENRVSCSDSSSDFQTIFQTMVSSGGHVEKVTFDTEVHEYTFELNAPKEVCKIGYQSQFEIASTPYLIEIVDNSTMITIYSGSHTFSPLFTSYVTPSSTIQLQAGISYTIKRVQIWGSSISYTIGRLAKKIPMEFPYSSGVMTITESKFYQDGGYIRQNLQLPYIDLILR